MERMKGFTGELSDYNIRLSGGRFLYHHDSSQIESMDPAGDGNSFMCAESYQLSH